MKSTEAFEAAFGRPSLLEQAFWPQLSWRNDLPLARPS